MRHKLPLVSVVIPTHNRKEKLVRLVNSILESNYPKDRLEIIVVDDASTDGTYEEIRMRFQGVKILRNEKELFLSGSRNVGIENAKGEYIFLIDDDNVVDRNCILELVKTMMNYSSVGIVGPIMYYYQQPSRVWCAGIKRGMVTSLTTFIGRDEIDKGQFSELIESEDFPNAFMIKKEVIERIGLFDEENFVIHYDEADFGRRVKKAGYRIVCNPRAKVWHDVPLPEQLKDKTRFFHVHDSTRAYYAARNRIIFHKKHSKWWQFLFFVLTFNWLFTMYYLKVILLECRKPFSERLKITRAYLRGFLQGLKWKGLDNL